jgi:uncharacterized protein (DUF1778 family)
MGEGDIGGETAAAGHEGPILEARHGTSDPAHVKPTYGPICRDIVWQTVVSFNSGDKMTQRTNRTEKLDLRLSRAAKKTLQAAAAAERKSVSEFVLDIALSEAEERLGDRRVFTLDAKGWDAFVAALDAPPRRHPRLERLFREPSVFDPKSEP